MGILANHVPSVEPLKPGLLEVIESGNSETTKWFGKCFSRSHSSPAEMVFRVSLPKPGLPLNRGPGMLRRCVLCVKECVADFNLVTIVSGGFANMHPSGLLTVNAVEAYPLSDFSADVSFKTSSVSLKGYLNEPFILTERPQRPCRGSARCRWLRL